MRAQALGGPVGFTGSAAIRSIALLIDENISIGIGNTTVVLCSDPISTSVCRYRSWMAAGCFCNSAAAMLNFTAASFRISSCPRPELSSARTIYF